MRVLLIISLLFSLFSCAPRRPAKVDEIGTKAHRTASEPNKTSSTQAINDNPKTTHTVVKGDSLYSIGFRYQKDYKTLATINNINPPYRIYPNQVIKLEGPVQQIVFQPTNNDVVQTQPIVSNQPLVATTEPLNNNQKITPSITTQPLSEKTVKPSNETTIKAAKPDVNKPIVNQPIIEKPMVEKPIVQKPLIKQPEIKQPVTNKPAAKKPMVVATPNNTNLKWLWPTDGKIRSTFLASNPARKGISIGGQEGQSVKAAEAGVVVYSGNGLLGYGELIIIKHNNTYLSAYGHNKSLKVNEGQSVQRGETIAELGSSGTNVNNLHFEIRKNGKPVNPLNYVKP